MVKMFLWYMPKEKKYIYIAYLVKTFLTNVVINTWCKPGSIICHVSVVFTRSSLFIMIDKHIKLTTFHQNLIKHSHKYFIIRFYMLIALIACLIYKNKQNSLITCIKSSLTYFCGGTTLVTRFLNTIKQE